MSYHLAQQGKGKAPEIEMPPLPPEQPIQVQQEQPEIHPDIAKEFVQSVEAQEPEEQEVEQEVQEVKPEPAPKKIDQAKNFRELKEQKEQIQRERDEYARRLHEYEQQLKPQAKQVEEEPETQYAPDDLVEAKYLKKYDKKIRELEEKLNNTEQRTTIHNVEARLKANYPDIEKVVNTDNIEILKAAYPELAQSLNSNPDIYSKAAATYTLIKKLGIMPEDTYMEDKQKAQKNAVKPRPLASVNAQQGDSPLSKANAFANGLTDDLKAQLRREMEEARKRM